MSERKDKIKWRKDLAGHPVLERLRIEKPSWLSKLIKRFMNAART